MKKIVLAVAAAAGLAFAGTAEAQFAIDVRAAYAIPMGNVTSGNSMSDSISGAIPLGVDARYKFTPNISAGVYFQYAPAFVKNCPAGASCSASDLRFGIEAVYAFMPEGSFNPWVSLGTGWEFLNGSASAGGLKLSTTVSGWEYFTVQVGVDFPLSKLFALGPYIGFSGGSYGSQSISDGSGQSASGSIPNTGFHDWLQFGVKGTFNL